MRFDLSEGFPLVTTKRLHLKSIVHELIWFLNGDTNVAYLQANGVGIWDEWADANGDLGPVYGKQWRAWEGADGSVHDQISWVLDEIKRNPNSRRLIVSAWNVADIEQDEAAALSLPVSVLCRRWAAFLPALSALRRSLSRRSLQHRQLCAADPSGRAGERLGVGDFVHTFGDAHLYLNHVEQAREQFSRTPRPLPRLKLNAAPSLFDMKAEDVAFEGYDPWPAIKAPVAV